MKSKFFDKIAYNPIIAAVNNINIFEEALHSSCEILFLLTGSIFNLNQLVDEARRHGKAVYVHLDLLEGFSRDFTSLKYIHEFIRPDGIISTKTSLVRKAKESNIFAIQRLFILDSLSLETGINSIRGTNLDAIEILPGIMPGIIRKIVKETSIPLIAGGLIEEKEDVVKCLKAGAIGVSSSDRSIWEL
jgi:glycerol uptake operon antiterminator